MTLSINQVLVICLILVLIAFVVVVAIMAKHAIELLKKTKGLVADGQVVLEESKGKVDEISTKVTDAANSVIADTTPTIKALGATATGLTAINLLKLVGGAIVKGGGIFSVMSDRRERKKSRKELKKSRKMVKEINKQTALEAKAIKRSKAVAKKAAKAEKVASKKAAAKAAKLSKKASKKAKKVAKKDKKKAKKAARKAKKQAKKQAK